MKKFALFILALFFAVSVFAQVDTNYHFSVKSGVIVWQKVFNESTTPDALYRDLRNKGVFFDLQEEEESVTGRIVKVEPNYQGAGYKNLGIALYIRDQKCSCYFNVEIKGDRYRVTARNFIFTPKYDNPLQRMGEENEIEVYALKGEELKKGFFNGPAQTLDKTLTDLFTLSDNDNW